MIIDKKSWNESFPKYTFRQYLEKVEYIDFKDMSYLIYLFECPLFICHRLLRIMGFFFFIKPSRRVN